VAREQQVANSKSTPSTFTVYAAAAAALVGGIGVGFAGVMVAAPQAERTKTALELRVESAREIKQALAQPIPVPEPLPPISSKTNKPAVKVAEAKPEPPTKPKRSRVARQARAAFASMQFEQRPFFGFMAFGPGMR
jgi:hypothetical protein